MLDPTTSARPRTRAVAVVLSLVLGCLAAVGTALPAASAGPALAKPPVPTTGAYLGASASVHNGETRTQAIDRTEAQIGRDLAIDHQFYKWDEGLITQTQRDDAAAGRYPFVSWKPQRTNGQIVTWGSIARGAEDARIRAYARTMRDFGQPMFATFNHEPYDETTKGWGTAAEFRAAFRRVVELFRAEGADNVAWVLVLTSWDYTQGRGDTFNPGTDVVDWYAADPYNFFQRDGSWQTMAAVARDFYAWGSRTGKPLMLAEWGSTEDPLAPGRKATWYDEAAATLAGWPNVKAAVYFNNLHDPYDWRIDTSPTSLAAFRRLANGPWFAPSFAGAPVPTTAPPTTVAPPTTAPPTTAPPTTVAPPPAPAPSVPAAIAHVGTATWAGNARAHAVTVPAGVANGDGMLLLLSSNNPAATLSAPSGGGTWQLLGTVDTGSVVSRVWRATATTTSARAAVRVTTSDYAKVDLTLLAYRGTATDPVAALRGVPETTTTATHATPATPVVGAGSWVVSYWVQKDSASSRAMTAPAGVTTRASGLGTGGGRLVSLVADSAGPVPTGTSASLRATAAAASRQASMWTIVLRPA